MSHCICYWCAHITLLIVGDFVRDRGRLSFEIDKSVSSTASTISTTAIEGIIDLLKQNRVRNSTMTNYYVIWKHFNKFIVKLDRKLGTWEERLTLYTGFLINNGRKSSTIRSYISAIKTVLQINDIDITHIPHQGMQVN